MILFHCILRLIILIVTLVLLIDCFNFYISNYLNCTGMFNSPNLQLKLLISNRFQIGEQSHSIVLIKSVRERRMVFKGVCGQTEKSVV